MLSFLHYDKPELLVVVVICSLNGDFGFQFVEIHQDQLLSSVKIIASLDTLIILIIDIRHEFTIFICQSFHNGRLAEPVVVFSIRVNRFVLEELPL